MSDLLSLFELFNSEGSLNTFFSFGSKDVQEKGCQVCPGGCEIRGHDLQYRSRFSSFLSVIQS